MTNPIVTFSRTNPYFVKVTADNGLDIGDIVQDVDGLWYFWPNVDLTGAWSEWILQPIVDHLVKLNEKSDLIV